MDISVGRKMCFSRRIVAALALTCLAPLATGIATAADCRSDPASGVDWSVCNKRLLMLGGSNLEGAMLTETDFTYTDLRGSNVKSANFEKAKLVRTSLASSDLAGANFNKVEAYRSDFAGANADKVTFVNAEMQRSSFKAAKLSGADFSKAELGRANFDGAILTGAKFAKANLSRASLKGAKLDGGVNFEDAFMLLTVIEGTDLSTAAGLEQEQINLACGDDATKLPSGLKAPPSWPCGDADD
jgi:uncharacterized protein YjbI with pentapeptide repeats